MEIGGLCMGRTVVRTVGVAGAQRPMGLTERRKKATKPESGVPVGKKTPGGAGTHTGHTRDTRAHTGTRITQTNLTTIQTQRHTRKTTQRPNPRPTQLLVWSRPLPAYRYR